MESVDADTSSAALLKRTYDTAFLLLEQSGRRAQDQPGLHTQTVPNCVFPPRFVPAYQWGWSGYTTQLPTRPPVPLEGAQRHRRVPHVVQVGRVVCGSHRQLVAGAGAPAHGAHVGLGVHLGGVGHAWVGLMR